MMGHVPKDERENQLLKTSLRHFQATAVIKLGYTSCSYYYICNTKGSGSQRQPSARIYHKAVIHTLTTLSHLLNTFICLSQQK